MTEVPSRASDVPNTADGRLIPGFAQAQAPGAAVYTGEGHAFDPFIEAFDWTPDSLRAGGRVTPDDLTVANDPASVTWIDVRGIHDVDVVLDVAERFGIHPLTVEDILSPGHRPKVEPYPEYVFFVTKMVTVLDAEIRIEQVSLLLGRHWVITFQEHPEDVFDSVRQRIHTAAARIRKRDADYLAYALLDAITDGYLGAVDEIGGRVETLEEGLEAGTPAGDTPAQLHNAKRELLALRKSVAPMREAVTAAMREEDWIQPRTVPFLRDLHDHLLHLGESIDIYREMVSSLLDLHLSRVSQRTNEEMRLLTVIATIFIPLTFLAGVYGMNFQHMPELAYRWAYPTFWIAVVVIGVGLGWLFRQRRWL